MMVLGIGGMIPGLKPVSDWVDPRRSALMGFSAGMLSGDPGAAMRYAMQGRGMDQQYASDMQAREEAERERNATAEWLKQSYPQFANLPPAQGFEAAMKMMAQAQSGEISAPANVREWEYFSGLSPEQQTQYLTMKRANPYLDVGTGFVQGNPANSGIPLGPVIPKNGDVPTGFQQTAPGQIAPMPGSEPDRERNAAKVKAESAINTLEEKNKIAVEAIDAAIGQANWTNTGNVMGNAGWVPFAGQGALDLGKTLDTIKANIGFEELQTMRDNSPTGGALGQVTERELAFLQSTIANIEQAQSEEQLKANLKVLRDFIEGSQERRRAAYQQQFTDGGFAPSGPVTGPTTPEGNYVYNPATGKLERQ